MAVVHILQGKAWDHPPLACYAILWMIPKKPVLHYIKCTFLYQGHNKSLVVVQNIHTKMCDSEATSAKHACHTEGADANPRATNATPTTRVRLGSGDASCCAPFIDFGILRNFFPSKILTHFIFPAGVVAGNHRFNERLWKPKPSFL